MCYFKSVTLSDISFIKEVTEARNLPKWAYIYGVKSNPMQSYCTRIQPKDRFPRGMENKLESLRRLILRQLKLKVKERT